MALQFKLPGAQLHQMAMLNTPIFGAAQPQTFLDLMQALPGAIRQTQGAASSAT